MKLVISLLRIYETLASLLIPDETFDFFFWANLLIRCRRGAVAIWRLGFFLPRNKIRFTVSFHPTMRCIVSDWRPLVYLGIITSIPLFSLASNLFFSLLSVFFTQELTLSTSMFSWFTCQAPAELTWATFWLEEAKCLPQQKRRCGE
jgi:hypothetical protein